MFTRVDKREKEPINRVVILSTWIGGDSIWKQLLSTSSKMHSRCHRRSRIMHGFPDPVLFAPPVWVRAWLPMVPPSQRASGGRHGDGGKLCRGADRGEVSTQDGEPSRYHPARGGSWSLEKGWCSRSECGDPRVVSFCCSSLQMVEMGVRGFQQWGVPLLHPSPGGWICSLRVGGRYTKRHPLGQRVYRSLEGQILIRKTSSPSWWLGQVFSRAFPQGMMLRDGLVLRPLNLCWCLLSAGWETPLLWSRVSCQGSLPWGPLLCGLEAAGPLRVASSRGWRARALAVPGCQGRAWRPTSTFPSFFWRLLSHRPKQVQWPSPEPGGRKLWARWGGGGGGGDSEN